MGFWLLICPVLNNCQAFLYFYVWYDKYGKTYVRTYVKELAPTGFKILAAKETGNLKCWFVQHLEGNMDREGVEWIL